MPEDRAYGQPPPPPGWADETWRALQDELGGSGHGHADGQRCLEFCPICRAADVLRTGAPPELRGQLSDFQREALLTLRALIDHYIERLDARPETGGRVEDIPID